MSVENNFEVIIEKTIEEFNLSNSIFKAYYIPIDITEKGTLIELI
jgi:hypothetical protein